MCKNMFVSNGKKAEDFAAKILEAENPSCIKGDIDELIFPDDEPYYISER